MKRMTAVLVALAALLWAAPAVAQGALCPANITASGGDRWQFMIGDSVVSEHVTYYTAIERALEAETEDVTREVHVRHRADHRVECPIPWSLPTAAGDTVFVTDTVPRVDTVYVDTSSAPEPDPDPTPAPAAVDSVLSVDTTVTTVEAVVSHDSSAAPQVNVAAWRDGHPNVVLENPPIPVTLSIPREATDVPTRIAVVRWDGSGGFVSEDVLLQLVVPALPPPSVDTVATTWAEDSVRIVTASDGQPADVTVEEGRTAAPLVLLAYDRGQAHLCATVAGLKGWWVTTVDAGVLKVADPPAYVPDAGCDVQWSSTDEAVATVQAGTTDVPVQGQTTVATAVAGST